MAPTPKHPCIDCKKEVGSKSASCCVCKRWTHVGCHIDEEDYAYILRQVARHGAHAWSCDGCMAGYKELGNACAGNSTQLKELKEIVQGLVLVGSANKDAIALTNTRVAELNAKIVEMKDSSNDIVEDVVDQVSRECDEREEKKSNLILYGIAEADANLLPLDRKSYDENKIKAIFTDIDFECDDYKSVVFKTIRLGMKGKVKRNGIELPRPVQVGFRKISARDYVLDSAKKLSNSINYKHISIARDLTQKQRATEKVAFDKAKELNSKMDSEASKNWIHRATASGPRGLRTKVSKFPLTERDRLNRVRRESDQDTTVGTGGNSEIQSNKRMRSPGVETVILEEGEEEEETLSQSRTRKQNKTAKHH